VSPGGDLLWQDEFCRVVRVPDFDYPEFCRVILQRHVTEMTDLAPEARTQLMKAVFATERALRALLAPDKINLASLGNQTPHLHWHVIPRFRDDRHFPNSVWSADRIAPWDAPRRAKTDTDKLRAALLREMETET
jgi:diadenosine tetraphosphate (Ap4A) HIT family hydrolase